MEKVIFSTVYNRKNRLTRKGAAPIQICAYLGGKRKYFSTAINIAPEHWDKKHQRIKPTAPNGVKLQKQISDFIQRLESYELDRRNAGKPFTLEYLTDCLQGKDFRYFTDFVRYELENNLTNAKATTIGKTTTYKTLKEFKENILFEEMNFELLRAFENHLIDKGLGMNTRNKYFRHIRTFVNLAIDKEYMEQNKYPFRKFKAQTETTTREFLYPE